MQLHELVRKACTSLFDRAYIHPLLPSGHLQTFWTAIYADFFAKPRVDYIREIIKAPDGGAIGLDWTKLPDSSATKKPYVFVLHGLTGGSHEAYIQDLVIALREFGYEAVVMHFRGCNETPVNTPHLYSGSCTEDVQVSVDYIKSKYRGVTLIGAGFSLGSNVLVKYAGQKGLNCPFVAIISVGNPYDFLGALRALNRTFFGRYIYSTRMGRNLARLFKKHHTSFKDCEWLENMDEILKAKNIVEFDSLATSKHLGYKTVHEYYRFGSCAQDIPYLTVPSLFLSSLDDPVCSKEALPYFEILSNPFCVLATTSFGGHLGWFRSGWDNIFPTKRWFPKPLCQFVHAIFKVFRSDFIGAFQPTR